MRVNIIQIVMFFLQIGILRPCCNRIDPLDNLYQVDRRRKGGWGNKRIAKNKQVIDRI